MAKIIPKVGEIWTVTRRRDFFDRLKKGDVFYHEGYRLELIKKRYWSSEMDCNDLVVLTLRRLPDKVPKEKPKETFITYLKKCFKQLFKNNKNNK
jgi:hypothetical protein